MLLTHGLTARILGFLAVPVLCSCASPPPTDLDPQATVSALLRASAEAWNAGDLDGFVSDYADGPSTSFMDGRRPQYGSDWIRSNYAARFMPGGNRDSLRFEEVAARMLGDDHILATARYVLFRGDSMTSSGPFTLILERRQDTWKIIHDHTNADPD